MKQKFFIGLLSLLAAGCAQETPPTNVEHDNYVNPYTTSTIGLYKMEPAEDSTNVDLDAPIVLTFSGKIDQRLEDFQIRVEDDFGNIYATEKTFNDNMNEVTLRRKINNQYVAWDLGTRLNITAEYLLGAEDGQKIWPYSASLWTKGQAEAPDGSFKVLDVYPRATLITPGTFIEIKFSKSVAPGSPTPPSTSLFSNAFQFYLFQTRTSSGYQGLVPMNNPEIQLVASPAGVADKLYVRPAGGWPAPNSIFYPNGLLICILRSHDLRAASNNQQLATGSQGALSPCPSAHKQIEKLIFSSGF